MLAGSQKAQPPEMVARRRILTPAPPCKQSGERERYQVGEQSPAGPGRMPEGLVEGVMVHFGAGEPRAEGCDRRISAIDRNPHPAGEAIQERRLGE